MKYDAPMGFSQSVIAFRIYITKTAAEMSPRRHIKTYFLKEICA